MLFENKTNLDSFYGKNGEWAEEENFESVNTYDFEDKYDLFLIRKIEGKYFVGLIEDRDDLIEIPEELAKIMIVAIEAQKRVRKRDSYQMSSEGFSTDYLTRFFVKFNCHKVLLYILGFRGTDLNLTNFISHDYLINLIDVNYQAAQNPEELEKKLDLFPKEKFPIVGRIIQYKNSFLNIGGGEKHSYIVLGKTKKGEYICFEKVGFKYYPIRITKLPYIYNDYPNGGHQYGFKPLSEVVSEIKNAYARN